MRSHSRAVSTPLAARTPVSGTMHPPLLPPLRRSHPHSPRNLTLAAGVAASPALLAHGTEVSYGDLRQLVADRRAELGSTRRFVMVTSGNEIEPIVTYLAALAGGHPVMLVEDGPPGSAAARHVRGFIDRFDPDVVALGGQDGWQLDERRRGTRHSLHPDLALMNSTSGSTGSPKLVRISHDNLRSNAASIARYLDLTPDDRAATTLPLHYCYGLSVLNSHLAAGASIHLTDRSVTDDEFWTEFDRVGATSFAGVPYTFDLLDASGFATRVPDRLRFVTQAGGRLAPERVREYARLGRERGFGFVVMYGQTEATARMAYLPADLAESGAGAIGVPIPGGRFRIDAPADGGAGELVYSGPNVMLGYAEHPEDFAAGRVIDELRTGDLARLRDDGLYEIVGRASRFVKVFGLRIDLDQVERLLGESGHVVRAVAVDERLELFVRTARESEIVRTLAAEVLELPVHAIRVHTIAEFPRTSTGKPDHAALARYAAESETAASPEQPRGGGTPAEIRTLYRQLLGRPDADLDDSFAGLGGDSLSFVEVSIRLEEVLGRRLPGEWPGMTIRQLAALNRDVAAPEHPRRRMPSVETPALLRAIAIVLVVATHADLFFVQGGAHLLLAVVGYNLARFQLGAATSAGRVRALARSIAKVAVPAVLWIGAVGLLTGGYEPATALLVNSFTGAETWTAQWEFWFLEATVWTFAGILALVAIPIVDRVERRLPFASALVLLALALGMRFGFTGGVLAASPERYVVVGVAWIVVLGWLVARSTTLARRIVTTVIVVLSVPGFLGDLPREAVVGAGILILLWVPSLPVPRILVPVIAALASASMFIYLTHWQVYPPFEEAAPWLGTALSLTVGVLVWKLYTVASTRSMGWIRRGSRRMREWSARREGDDPVVDLKVDRLRELESSREMRRKPHL